jgi:HEAT repeat protein
MRYTAAQVAAGVLAILVGVLGAWAETPDTPDLDAAFRGLAAYEWGGDRAALDRIEQAVAAAHGDAAAERRIEARLDAVLASDSTRAAKDFVCRELVQIGSAQSVPALAALLPDPDLSHMGRYALERMPCPEAAKALRDALPSAPPAQRVGIINSLGMRGDAEAVPILVPLLGAGDAAQESASAAALGRIATPQAAAALVRFRAEAPPALRADATDACLDAADRLLAAGQAATAAGIYELLESSAEPEHVRLAAFRGMVAARPAEATERVVRALGGDEAGLRSAAAEAVLLAPGPEATMAFAAALGRVPPDGQVVLLSALAKRGDAAARPAVIAVLASADQAVRAAALDALGSLGSAEDVSLLAQKAAEGDQAERSAAADALARLNAAGADAAMASALGSAPAPVRVALLAALAARGAKDAVPAVLRAARDDDAQVRRAALEALRALADERQTTDLVALVVEARDDAERAAAEATLADVCGRGGERCADAVLRALAGADASTKSALLRALGRAGGPDALAAVRDALADPEPAVREAAVRVLAAWPDAGAMPALEALAESADNATYQALALQGYIRLAAEGADASAKVRLLQKALGLAKRPEEKWQALGALGAVPTADALRAVLPHLEDPAVAGEASAAAVRIAAGLGGGPNDLVRQAMEAVLRATKNPKLRAEAEKIRRAAGG